MGTRYSIYLIKEIIMEKFTFFWHGPFSQWTHSQFFVNGVLYNSAEAFMMTSKALYFGDHNSALKIMQSIHSKDQKAIGRKIKGFKPEHWTPIARDIVYRGSYGKFTQNQHLLQKLMDTKGTTLVEASPKDKIWGIGIAEDNPLALDRASWRGSNWLGEVLTELRDNLENGVEKKYNSLLDNIF